MSTAPADYENLLRAAIRQAMETAPGPVDDLRRYASKAAEAVAQVTGGRAALDLVPINEGEVASPTYQLQLRKVGSEAPPSDLGVYSVGPGGYPVRRWYARRNWESHPDTPNAEFLDPATLEGSFRWMVSHPDSRLVVLVTFLQQNVPSPSGPAGGAGNGR